MQTVQTAGLIKTEVCVPSDAQETGDSIMAETHFLVSEIVVLQFSQLLVLSSYYVDSLLY